jgi:hypothetical protein
MESTLATTTARRPLLQAMLTAAAVAPTIGLTLTWLWIMFLWLSGSADHLAWKAALVVLAVLTVCGVLIFLFGWLAALRLLIAPVVARWVAGLGAVLLPPSLATVLFDLVKLH